jgi:hypothetical protein
VIVGASPGPISGIKRSDDRSELWFGARKPDKECERVPQIDNSTYSRLVDNGKILDERWDYLTRKYSHYRRLGHFTGLNDQQVFELIDDIYHHYAQMQWYQEILHSTVEEINQLLEEIE